MRKVVVLARGKYGVQKDINLFVLTFKAARPAHYDALIILKEIDFVSFA
ncbi:MAG: hypothetical protein QGF78_03440 [Candidatus Bathyarchaeota archaeon]|nr:hypothetical protein [Candidatus Bathyarchaeota archaeon]